MKTPLPTVQHVLDVFSTTKNKQMKKELTALLEKKFNTSVDKINSLVCIKTCTLSEDETELYLHIIDSASASENKSTHIMSPYFR